MLTNITINRSYSIGSTSQLRSILGGMIILISNKANLQKLTMLTVKWWGDNGETMSEMKQQDSDSFVRVPIGIALMIACICWELIDPIAPI